MPGTVMIPSFFFPVDKQGWSVSPRGAGYLFGSDIAQNVIVTVVFIITFNFYIPSRKKC